MKFPETIVFQDISYSLVQVQRDFISAIYRDPNGENYLRIGDEGKIKSDIKNHEHLLNLKYPVSKIIKQGYLENMYYSLEESLGTEIFAVKFERDFIEDGKISDENFDGFFKILEKHFRSQLENIIPVNWTGVYSGILMDKVIEERPDLKERLLRRFELSKERLKGIPFTFCQGDFNPFNVLEKGVIDFECSHDAPILLDIFSPILYTAWFPINTDMEVSGLFMYSEEQRAKILMLSDTLMEEKGFGKVSHLYEEINFLKGVWLAAGLQAWPKFMHWRYKLLETLI